MTGELTSRPGIIVSAVIALCAGATSASAYTAEQQQACSGDAFRLCSSAIPDVDRVRVCMIANQAQLSPGCRAFFRPVPVQASTGAIRAGRPLSIAPARAGKPRKAATTRGNRG